MRVKEVIVFLEKSSLVKVKVVVRGLRPVLHPFSIPQNPEFIKGVNPPKRCG